MPNPLRGEAALGDYTLVFDFNAMCLLEDATGQKTPQLLAQMQMEIGFRELRAFVWAGLQRKHEGLSIAEAGEIIGSFGVKGVEVALSAVNAGITAAFVQPKAKAANPPKAAEDGTT